MRVARSLFVIVVVLAFPGASVAAEGHDALVVPGWTVVPFALTLLSIAVLPVAAEHWWHKNRNKALVALVLSLPVMTYLFCTGPAVDATKLPLGVGKLFGHAPPAVQDVLKRQGTYALLHSMEEYMAFIVMLGSLYTVSGGIVLRGDLRFGPLTNTAFLTVGAVLANGIGTTGASMLLIRPYLSTN